MAMEEERSIHLSRKRDDAPMMAEISAKGELFLCLKNSTFDNGAPALKKVKKAFDVLRQQVVARSVAVEVEDTAKRRHSEESARADVAGAPWMVKEYFHGIYFNGEVTKWVTIREKWKEDLLHWVERRIPPSQEQKNLFIHQLLQQMAAIHKKGIHGDLKWENILVSSDGKRASIFDFDCYRRLRDYAGRAESNPGTLRMSPPEFMIKWMRDPQSDFSDVHVPASDIWGLGHIIASIQYGRRQGLAPWMDLPDSKVGPAICKTPWHPDEDSQEPIAFLIYSMLRRRAHKRITAGQALEFFEMRVLQSKKDSSSFEEKDFGMSSPSGKLLDPFELGEADQVLRHRATH